MDRVGLRSSMFGCCGVDIAEEPSNGFNVICHGNGLTANGMSKHVASATVDAKLDIHKTPPPSKRLLFVVLAFSMVKLQYRVLHGTSFSFPLPPVSTSSHSSPVPVPQSFVPIPSHSRYQSPSSCQSSSVLVVDMKRHFSIYYLNFFIPVNVCKCTSY